jgi:hypothetical protein
MAHLHSSVYLTRPFCGATELLTQASRLVMLDVVRIIFRRLPDLPPSVPPPESAALHPLRSGAPVIPVGALTLELEPSMPGAAAAGQQPADGPPAELRVADAGGEAAQDGETRESAESSEQAAGAAAVPVPVAADSVGLDSTTAAGVQPPRADLLSKTRASVIGHVTSTPRGTARGVRRDCGRPFSIMRLASTRTVHGNCVGYTATGEGGPQDGLF